MPELLASLPWFFAANAPPPEAGPSPLSTLLPFLPIPFLFYFLMIRPKQIEDRKRQEMIGALKKNDKVMTTAGIYGTVVSTDLDHDRVVLRVDDDRGVKLTFSRSSVLKVVETSPDKDKEKAAESA
jgi:preprotein translocase subunit YajC